MALPTYTKDPQANLDYSLDWSQWLGTDTIAGSTWTVPTGLFHGTALFSNTVATVWISGGTTERSYIVTNHITTDQGREDERSILINIKER